MKDIEKTMADALHEFELDNETQEKNKQEGRFSQCKFRRDQAEQSQEVKMSALCENEHLCPDASISPCVRIH